MTLPPTLRRIGPALLVLTVIAVLVSGCIPGTQPTGSDGLPIPTPPAPPLTPVQPTDLFSLFAWLFTPIFQAAFIVLIAAYQFLYNLGIEGAILWAIVVTFVCLGLRVSELCGLMLEDTDLTVGATWILGKGRGDSRSSPAAVGSRSPDI